MLDAMDMMLYSMVLAHLMKDLGMAKETAHQLGTPVSALQGWVEMLKESHPDPAMVTEMEKDVAHID